MWRNSFADVRLSSLRTIAVLAFLVFVGSGCGLYVIKKSSPAGDHKGIPFYVKTSGCKREIARLKPYYLVSLQEGPTEKPTFNETITICQRGYQSAQMKALREAVKSAQDVYKNWDNMKTADILCDPFDITDSIRAQSQDAKLGFLASDAVSSYAYVDYDTPYTLNVRRPVVGSASATTKLAEDGTLSEGTAQTEEKTVETLLSLVPSSELIKTAVVGFVPVSEFQLKIEQKAAKYTWTYRDPDFKRACEADKTLKGDLAGLNPDFAMEEAGAEKKGSDENVIKVNGSIQLPKPKDTKPEAKK